MAEESDKTSAGGRIEGGLDAVVIGSGLDAIGAAALLGKAGLKTVLLGGEDTEDGPQEFAPGFFRRAGELFATHLDPDLADALNLYRHGLEFVNRRMETAYFFADGGVLAASGDPARLQDSVAAMAPAQTEGFADFMTGLLDAARAMRPVFHGGRPQKTAPPLSTLCDSLLSESLLDAVRASGDEHVQALLTAEALIGTACRPDEPGSASGLARRWAGEAAGLQGAVAIAAEGASGVLAAARRAAQAARVDIRARKSVNRVLVEWDRVAGVETGDGGQLRAPIVISAFPAATSFLHFVGPHLLDVEFQAALAAPRPPYAAARVDFAISEAGAAGALADHLTRRMVYAPDVAALMRAYAAARQGEVDAPLLFEAATPSAFEPGLARDGGAVLAAIVQPVPVFSDGDDDLREKVSEAARKTLLRMIPDLGDAIVAVDSQPVDGDARLSCAALHHWTLARRLARAGSIDGYFFCGPEVQIGGGLDGGAGRRAAEAALVYSRKGAYA